MTDTSASSPSRSEVSSSTSERWTGDEAVAEAWGDGWRPEPPLTVSGWADQHRMLSSASAAEPGPWRTDRTPYLREPMDALSPSSPYETIIVMKGSQVGFSEAGNNWIGYVIDHAPGPGMVVQPTVETAKRFSKQRIDPLLETTARLRDLVKPSRSRDSGNTVLAKSFRGGIWVLTGANSAVGLRSMPARYLFEDEIDAYPADVEGEGDPDALAEARTRTFGWRRKVYKVSTPTIAGQSRIERQFLATDQRRYFVPCPHCAHMQWLRFEMLRWPKGEPEAAAYHCEACGGAIEERHKTAMMRQGEWRPTAETADPRSIGFHLSSLYSPVGWLSWADIARQWEAAQGHAEAIKTFKNTILGETFAEQSEAPDWKRLWARREPWRMGTVPRRALLLVGAADMQRDRIEIEVWGVGRRLERWLVDHIVIAKSPAGEEAWRELDEVIERRWPHQSGVEMRLAKFGIDSGGEYTQEVYRWARRHASAGVVFALKGASRWQEVPVTGPTKVDVTERGRKLEGGAKLWTIAVDRFKSELYRHLAAEPPTESEIRAGMPWPQGYVHLGRGVTEEQVQQLVAEQLVTTKDKRGFPKREWRKLRERNEALDLAVYARAAAWLLGVDRWAEAKWRALEKQLGDAEPGPEDEIPDDEDLGADAPSAAPLVDPEPEAEAASVAGVVRRGRPFRRRFARSSVMQ